MTSPRALLLWDERLTEYDFGPAHPFQMRYRAEAARRLLAAGAHSAPLARSGPIEPAPDEVLGRFHTERYRRFVRERSGTSSRLPLDQGDTPSFPGCEAAAARVVGATSAGLRALLAGECRRAFSPAGGLHHAHADRASGFCIFNDVAVAIASALRPHGPLSRVAYVDVDAHHGDGVMYGFYGDGRLLDIDLHQDGRTIFPGTGAVGETGAGDGAGAKVNLPLPPGSGDGALVPIVRRVVVPLLREFRPELVVIQHGLDGHVGDRLASLEYTDAGYDRSLEALLAVADGAASVGVLVTGGGGYDRSNVTLGLERVGRRLAGEPIPRTAEEPEEPIVERLVSDLERALGRPFPAA